MIWLGISSVLAWIHFCYWHLLAQLIWLGQLGLSSHGHFYPGLHLIISISEFPESKPQCIITYQALVFFPCLLMSHCLSYSNLGSVWEGATWIPGSVIHWGHYCYTVPHLPSGSFVCPDFFNFTVYWEHFCVCLFFPVIMTLCYFMGTILIIASVESENAKNNFHILESFCNKQLFLSLHN